MKKHRIKVVLYWEGIQNDLENKAWRIARLSKLSIDMQSSTGASVLGDKVESEISLSDEDLSILHREMRTALAEVVSMAAEYVWSKSHESDNKTLAGDTEVVINLMMPCNWNLAGCASLGAEIHSYIVSRALTAWFVLTGVGAPQQGALAEQKAQMEMARAEIEKILERRVRMMRRGESLEVIVGNEVMDVWLGSTPYSATALPSTVPTYGNQPHEIVVDMGSSKYLAVAVAVAATPYAMCDSASGLKAVCIGKVTKGGRDYRYWTWNAELGGKKVVVGFE